MLVVLLRRVGTRPTFRGPAGTPHSGGPDGLTSIEASKGLGPPPVLRRRFDLAERSMYATTINLNSAYGRNWAGSRQVRQGGLWRRSPLLRTLPFARHVLRTAISSLAVSRTVSTMLCCAPSDLYLSARLATGTATSLEFNSLGHHRVQSEVEEILSSRWPLPRLPLNRTNSATPQNLAGLRRRPQAPSRVQTRHGSPLLGPVTNDATGG